MYPPMSGLHAAALLAVGRGEHRVLQRVVILALLHVVVQLSGLGEHPLDARRRRGAAEELPRHLGEVRQALGLALGRVSRYAVVARLPPRQHVQVEAGISRQLQVLLQVVGQLRRRRWSRGRRRGLLGSAAAAWWQRCRRGLT